MTVFHGTEERSLPNRVILCILLPSGGSNDATRGWISFYSNANERGPSILLSPYFSVLRSEPESSLLSLQMLTSTGGEKNPWSERFQYPEEDGQALIQSVYGTTSNLLTTLSLTQASSLSLWHTEGDEEADEGCLLRPHSHGRQMAWHAVRGGWSFLFACDRACRVAWSLGKDIERPFFPSLKPAETKCCGLGTNDKPGRQKWRNENLWTNNKGKNERWIALKAYSWSRSCRFW